MQTTTYRKGGDNARLPCHHRSNRKSVGTERNHANAFGVIGTDVLKLNISQICLKSFVPNILEKEIKAGSAEYLHATYKHFMELYGEKATQGIPGDTTQIQSIIAQMKDRTNQDISLYTDDEYKLHLVQSKGVDSPYSTYFIAIKEADKFRPKLKNIVLRFIQTLHNNTEIPYITELPDYDYIIDSSKEWLFNDNDDLANEEKEGLEAIIDNYDKNGPIYNKFRDLSKLEPVTRKELEGFRPKNKKERLLIESMLEMMPFIESHFYFSIYSCFTDPVSGIYDMEKAYQNNDGIIDFAILCSVIYDFDEFVERLEQDLESELNGGYTEEYLEDHRVLTPKSDKELKRPANLFMKTFTNFLERYYEEN